MLKRGSQFFIIFCMFLIFVPALSWGQECRATVTGVVTDSSKAVFPNAIVTVHNLDTK